MHLSGTDLFATYRVLEAFRLPRHSGSLIRGVLGRALRRAACAAPSPCAADCSRPFACTYSRLFDAPVPSPPPHKLLNGSPNTPKPLLPLIPPPGALRLRTGDTFVLGVRVLVHLDPVEHERLVGALKGITELPWGRDHGRLEAVSVTDRPAPEVRSDSSSPRHATLITETPAWLEEVEEKGGKGGKKKLLRNPDFRTLFRHLRRHVTSLCALYGQLSPDEDDERQHLDARCDEVTARASLKPVRWKRHSLESDKRHPMKGLMGSVELHGNLAPFLPTLRLAELGHIGKATSYGLGRITLTVT